MLSRILKTELRIEKLGIQNHHIFCKRNYSTARDRLWKWKEPDYLGIWTHNASFNSKFLKTVRSSNTQYQYHKHQNHFKLLKSMVHTDPSREPGRTVPFTLVFVFELLHCIVIICTLAIAFMLVIPQNPDEPYLANQPLTTEFIPTEYDLNMLNGKLKQFYAHPGRGMDLNSDDLNTFFVSLPSTAAIRPYVNFLPVTEESETSASLPVKVSVPYEGQYFNCILYYKLVQVDDRWTTELERVKPIYSTTELSASTIQFFHRDFLNPNFFKIDPELQKLLGHLEAVHINRFGLLLNILKVPKKKVELTDEEIFPYETVFKTPLFWLDDFPLPNDVPRQSIGYSLLFDNEKFE